MDNRSLIRKRYTRNFEGCLLWLPDVSSPLHGGTVCPIDRRRMKEGWAGSSGLWALTAVRKRRPGPGSPREARSGTGARPSGPGRVAQSRVRAAISDAGGRRVPFAAARSRGDAGKPLTRGQRPGAAAPLLVGRGGARPGAGRQSDAAVCAFAGALVSAAGAFGRRFLAAASCQLSSLLRRLLLLLGSDQRLHGESVRLEAQHGARRGSPFLCHAQAGGLRALLSAPPCLPASFQAAQIAFPSPLPLHPASSSPQSFGAPPASLFRAQTSPFCNGGASSRPLLLLLLLPLQTLPRLRGQTALTRVTNALRTQIRACN